MGVTIHYTGTIQAEKYQTFEEIVVAQCKLLNWPFEKTDQLQKAGGLIGKFIKREGSRPKLRIHPHSECEPLTFEFDYNWSIEDYVKTQFSPPEVHIEIVNLLSASRTVFAAFEIVDESEFAETRDPQLLAQSRAEVEKMLEGAIAKGMVGPLRMPDGRIVDCYMPEKK